MYAEALRARCPGSLAQGAERAKRSEGGEGGDKPGGKNVFTAVSQTLDKAVNVTGGGSAASSANAGKC